MAEYLMSPVSLSVRCHCSQYSHTPNLEIIKEDIICILVLRKQGILKLN